jgi:hypothetical protein
MFIASGLLGLFIPIFLYQLFDNSFVSVFAFYGISSFLYFLFIPLGIKLADEKFGLQKSLKLSLFFLSAFYITFYLVEKDTILLYIPLGILCLTLFRILFWTPFRTDLAKFTNKKNRGRQLSSFEALNMILAVILPIISAFIINKYSYDVLFIIAIGIYLLTIIPFRLLPPTKENFSWSVPKTYKEFFKSIKNKKVAIAFMANGMETFVALVIWPIFIFELLKGNFLEVGIVSSAIILITVVLQLSLGKIIDKKLSKGTVLKWGTMFYSVGWIIKIFILTSFHIFIAGAYHSITKIFTKTPFDTFVYDLSANEGHYVDEYSVIMEMSVHAGRFLMFVIASVLYIYFGLTATFVIAAIASIALNLVSEQDLYFHRKLKLK